MIQETIDQKFECCTPAWLDDLIVVPQGNKQKHVKKLTDAFSERENPGSEQ